MQIRIRQITDPADPAIKAFGDLQERTYADPDLLIPPDVLPYMLARQSGARRNFMLVAEDEQGRVAGGTVFHYLGGAANSGFSSYLAVAPEVRGQGLAKRLHAERFAVLDGAAGGAELPGLFIDVVAPERLTPEEVERERSVGLDPADRRRIFQRMGFRRVDVAYYQPPEGSGGEAITTMDLLFCPRRPGAERIPSDLVAETMRAYWTGWLGKAVADRHAAELRRRCGGEWVALLTTEASAPTETPGRRARSSSQSQRAGRGPTEVC